jgi:hypothetical protein
LNKLITATDGTSVFIQESTKIYIDEICVLVVVEPQRRWEAQSLQTQDCGWDHRNIWGYIRYREILTVGVGLTISSGNGGHLAGLSLGVKGRG